MSAIDPFLPSTRIAYFSMEIALRSDVPTYAGGLGILAGDTVRSCADLALPVVFVSLVSSEGYFRQRVDKNGHQTEEPDNWDPAKLCTPLEAMVAVPIEGRPVWIRPWLYVCTCPLGHRVPVILLDTDLEQNADDDRALTRHLYGGDETYRLKQEIVLGLGGLRLLRALGFELHTYHLNEGHAAILTLDLLNRWRILPADQIEGESPYDIGEVRERCVFTTHTPVEAGHDRFSYELFERLLPGFVEQETLRHLAGRDRMNMTQLALNLSGYVNGVARRHAETAAHMFPGYHVHSVTNGVHAGTWTHPAFARLYQQHFPNWTHEPEILVRVMQLPEDEIWRCHEAAKSDLIARVEAMTGNKLDPSLPIIGYARRMTGYKRPDLLFRDIGRLSSIAARQPLQIVMAGKAHPHDGEGKEAIRRIHEMARQLEGEVKCVFVPGYDMDLAATLTAGSDIWLNTPLPPMEASGTSGMKAALNGGLNLSVLDGWWIEAWIEGVTGWAIGDDAGGAGASHDDHAAALYDKLENTVLPLFYDDPARWRWMMKQAIGNIAYYFNSQRMMRRYATEAYLR